jgi:hypothetical protein
VNLRNKQYCIFNEQYDKETYLKKVAELNLSSYGSLLRVLERANKLAAKHPVKFMRGAFNSNSTGDELYHSKNTRNAFASTDLEDCAYILTGQRAKDCEDCYVAVEKAERAYDCIGAAGCQNIIANHLGWFNFDSTYTDCCENSHNLFMCVGLRKKQYCILNKQYTKEEYEALIPRLKKHMDDMPYIDIKGRIYKYSEFFPGELSPYAYNETIAQEYFPLTKEDATTNNYGWANEVEKSYVVTMPADSISDDIRTVGDDIKSAVIGCEHEGTCAEKCTKAFKLTPQEFQFYKQYNLPLPRFCPNCRHYQRISGRNSITLSHRTCQCAGKSSQNGIYQNQVVHYHEDAPCANEFETPNASHRADIVYCEQCYQSEVI